MQIEIKVPVLAESISEATVMVWHKQEGEWVNAEEKIVDIETDKVVLEVIAPQAGRLQKCLKAEGELVNSDELIAYLEDSATADSATNTVPTQAKAAAVSDDLLEIKVPVLAESISEATLMQWQKKAGDWVDAEEKIVDIETDKVVLEVVAPATGEIAEIVKGDGSSVSSDEVIALLRLGVGTGKPKLTEKAAAPAPHVAQNAGTKAVPPKTSPSVRRMAHEQGIDPNQVPHQGDRVTKDDISRYQAQQQSQAAKPAAAPQANAAPAAKAVTASIPVAEARGRPQERVPMTRLRRRVAERLLYAQQEHAILTTFNEINMQPVMDLRNKYKEPFQKTHNVKLGFMSFFVKAAVAALQKFPIINASTQGEDIVYHGFYDIGIAVSSPRGLVVPILRNADQASFAQIEATIADFGARARDNKLEIGDLEGGTFSITNGGIFGSMLSTPILNPPQSAILGMHNIVERPIAENGEVVIRPIMYVALSYDHRIIDGRDAVQFLVAIKQALEDPARLLLAV